MFGNWMFYNWTFFGCTTLRPLRYGRQAGLNGSSTVLYCSRASKMVPLNASMAAEEVSKTSK
jgi:hypothetical protein